MQFAGIILSVSLLLTHLSGNGTLYFVQSSPVQEGVAGVVSDSAGRPVVGVVVHAEAISRPRPAIPEIAIVTDENGRYKWPLPPAEYQITIAAEGFEKATKRATVSVGRQTILHFQLKHSR